MKVILILSLKSILLALSLLYLHNFPLDLMGGFNGYHGMFHGSTGGFNGPNAMFTNVGYSRNQGSHFKSHGRGRGPYQSGPQPYQVHPYSSPAFLVLALTFLLVKSTARKVM